MGITETEGKSPNIKPEDAIYQTLSVNGDGTGVISQNVDGATTPTKFFIQPPITEKYTLRRMNLFAIDSNFNNALLYGAIATLSVGIKIYVEDDSGIIKDYTEFRTIKRAYDWGLLSGVDATSAGGAGADPFSVRWTFGAGACDIYLDGSNNERFVMEISDDLTGLDDQLAQVQGFRSLL